MKYRVTPGLPVFPHHARPNYLLNQSRSFISFVRKFRAARARASINDGSGNSQIEGMREKGIELEFQPDVKIVASACHVLMPGIPNKHGLEEAASPLDKYASLRDFFGHILKEGSRPIDYDLHCLVSPVDGTVLRFGELRGAGAMIEQVKGLSYSVCSLLGASRFVPTTADGNMNEDHSQSITTTEEKRNRSWWSISLASTKVWDPKSLCPKSGLFYCVIYFSPGDYHRIHSPVERNILVRRHFSFK